MTDIPMTKEEFILAMGGQERLDEKGLTVIECDCDHECCRGWDVE